MTQPATNQPASAPPQGEMLSSSVTESSASTAPAQMSRKEKGGIGYVLMWMLGVPIPLLILFALLRGCA